MAAAVDAILNLGAKVGVAQDLAFVERGVLLGEFISAELLESCRRRRCPADRSPLPIRSPPSAPAAARAAR